MKTRAFLLLIIFSFALITAAPAGTADKQEACLAFDLSMMRSTLPQEAKDELKKYYFSRITGLTRFKVLNGAERQQLFNKNGIMFADDVNHIASQSLVNDLGIKWYITAGIIRKGEKFTVYITLDDLDPATYIVSSKNKECGSGVEEIKKTIDILILEINDPSKDNPVIKK